MDSHLLFGRLWGLIFRMILTVVNGCRCRYFGDAIAFWVKQKKGKVFINTKGFQIFRYEEKLFSNFRAFPSQFLYLSCTTCKFRGNQFSRKSYCRLLLSENQLSVTSRIGESKQTCFTESSAECENSFHSGANSSERILRVWWPWQPSIANTIKIVFAPPPSRFMIKSCAQWSPNCLPFPPTKLPISNQTLR